MHDNFNFIKDNAAALSVMQCHVQERKLRLVSQHQAHHGFENILSQSVAWLKETELMNSCDCCLFLFHSRRSRPKVWSKTRAGKWLRENLGSSGF